MRTVEPGTSLVRAVGALVAIVAVLVVVSRVAAQEVAVADESAAEITVRAAVSADELAGSVRALESSLRTAPPAANSDGVVSAEEFNALAEAGAKNQLSGLADELELLSAALASGADPAGEKALLDSLSRRAAALSQLGAGPSRIPIPPELQTGLVALWSDVKALSENRAAATAPAESSEIEAP